MADCNILLIILVIAAAVVVGALIFNQSARQYFTQYTGRSFSLGQAPAIPPPQVPIAPQPSPVQVPIAPQPSPSQAPIDRSRPFNEGMDPSTQTIPFDPNTGQYPPVSCTIDGSPVDIQFNPRNPGSDIPSMPSDSIPISGWMEGTLSLH